MSPQNPLKADDGMMPLADRLAGAARQARHPAMRVTDLETELGTNFTAETLDKIKAMYPRHNFVWIMGADNLVQIPEWKDWLKIFNTVPVAVFARPSYSVGAVFRRGSAAFRPPPGA